jgi:hypothetical protein
MEESTHDHPPARPGEYMVKQCDKCDKNEKRDSARQQNLFLPEGYATYKQFRKGFYFGLHQK